MNMFLNLFAELMIQIFFLKRSRRKFSAQVAHNWEVFQLNPHDRGAFVDNNTFSDLTRQERH